MEEQEFNGDFSCIFRIYMIDLNENVLSLPPGRDCAPGFISLGPSAANNQKLIICFT